MDRDVMNSMVESELMHIPKGGFEQNMLRASFNAYRRHDLSLDPKTPAGSSLAQAVASVRETHPDFVATVDEQFFRVG